MLLMMMSEQGGAGEGEIGSRSRKTWRKRFISEISSNMKLITLEKCCAIIAFNKILSIASEFRQERRRSASNVCAIVYG